MEVSGQLRQAVVLGVIQGPAELLPISSSAHINLVPWLLGWDRDGLDPELEKSFEIALHAGAAGALLIGRRRLLMDELRALDGRTASILLLSFLPAAFVGYRFERRIEQRLGSPGPIAASLIAGSVAMAAADRRPGRPARGPQGIRHRISNLRGGEEHQAAARGRGRGEATASDGLALGIAQAAALAPGISRNGATLAAARLRGFSRDQANLLSRIVALPVIIGATLLKGIRLGRRGTDPEHARILAAGTAASFASTLASQRLIDLVERDRALWPYAAYRVALAIAILVRLARRGSRES